MNFKNLGLCRWTQLPRSLPRKNSFFSELTRGPVAQGLEQSAHNRLVVGSIPTRPTKKYSSLFVENILFIP